LAAVVHMAKVRYRGQRAYSTPVPYTPVQPFTHIYTSEGLAWTVLLFDR